jgi:ABC-2 type transport system permease protein
MIRAFRAEMVKLLRRRVWLLTSAAVVVVAVGGTAIVLAGAEPAGPGPSGPGLTLQDLADAGGGTEVFRRAASFAGFFMFVVFVGAIAVEFGRGTFRTMLLRQPARLRLLAGKMTALLAYSAGVLAVTMVLTWIAARLIAPSQDIDTSAWMTMDGLAAGVADYAAVLFWITGYAVLGMMLGVLLRSVPVALGVGIAWAGPFEHLLQDAWDPASRLFPGLLLEAFVAGGTDEVAATRAFVTIAGYVALAAVVASTSLSRRDVTA